jgi:hypothetical protein
MCAVCLPTSLLRYQRRGGTCYLHSLRELSYHEDEGFRFIRNNSNGTITRRHIPENKSSFLILYTFRHTYCFTATNCTVQFYCPTVYTSTCFGNLQPTSPSHHCDVNTLSQSAVYSEVQYTIVKTLTL